jgi:hypothetical protein
MMVVVTVMAMADSNHDLSVCGFGKRCSENQSEHGKQKEFHNQIDGKLSLRVVAGRHILEAPQIVRSFDSASRSGTV